MPNPTQGQLNVRTPINEQGPTGFARTQLTLRSVDGTRIGDPTPLHYTFIYYGSQL